MYAKNNSRISETVKVQSDKGNLRLAFSTRYNPVFDGKRKYEPLGMRDTPENRLKAEAIAYRIENDLLHPDWIQLFDPTFAKYGMKSQYAALKLAAPIPESEPEMTVGAMWEEYLLWKQPQLQPTTFFGKFDRTFSNSLKGLQWKIGEGFTQTNEGVWDMSLSEVYCSKVGSSLSLINKRQLFSALSEAFTRLQSQGKTKLTVNPFVLENKTENKTDKYKSIINVEGELLRWWDTKDSETNPEERDRRAFTKDERDVIIKAFYTSDKPGQSQAAPLVEFLFLTGCRSGEAFAFEWKDIFSGRDGEYLRFSKSYNGQLKNTQVTKTGDIRIFKMYPKLRDLLLRIKPADAKPTDLVFQNTKGVPYSVATLNKLWNMTGATNRGIKYRYPGVVTQLVETGAISCYLSPYHTRHTFITLMAQAGTDLLLLATACGNSVEVIQRHYLGVNTEATFPDI